MPQRAGDGLAQAERDVHVARSVARDGHHEWACFAAQQAAEKAVTLQSEEAIRHAGEILAFVRSQMA